MFVTWVAFGLLLNWSQKKGEGPFCTLVMTEHVNCPCLWGLWNQIPNSRVEKKAPLVPSYGCNDVTTILLY